MSGEASAAERMSGHTAYPMAIPLSAANMVRSPRGMRESVSTARMVPQARPMLNRVSATRNKVVSAGLAATLVHRIAPTAAQAAAMPEKPASDSALGCRRARIATGT